MKPHFNIRAGKIFMNKRKDHKLIVTGINDGIEAEYVEYDIWYEPFTGDEDEFERGERSRLEIFRSWLERSYIPDYLQGLLSFKRKTT